MKKLENMTKEELEKAMDTIVNNAIQELSLFRINLRDWKRYKHTYDVLKLNGIVREDLAMCLIETEVFTKTDSEKEILSQLVAEIKADLKPKVKKLEVGR